MNTPSPPPFDVLALQHAAPLHEIEIGEKAYPLGQLNEAQFADLAAHGARIIEHGVTGKPLALADQDPSRALQHLLLAGDPNFVWETVRWSVTSKHCGLAAGEYMRQAVVRALRAGPAAIAANSSQEPQR